MLRPIFEKIGGAVLRHHHRLFVSIGCLGVLALSLLIPSGTLQSQSMPHSVVDQLQPYVRAMQVAGKSSSKTSFLLLPTLEAEELRVGSWVSGSPVLRLSRVGGPSKGWWSFKGRVGYRTGYPSDRNDGVLWQGKGVTAAFHLGSGISWGRVSVVLHPTIFWAENRDFSLWPVFFSRQPEEAYPFRWIDWPQRLDNGSFWSIDPGESELSVRLGRWMAGLSSRNRSWGPGIENSIVLGRSAGGFPHAFFSTAGPLSTSLGAFEAQWLFGRLSRSSVFLPREKDAGRYTTGVTVVWSPHSGLDGLHLGAALMKYGPWLEHGWEMVSDVFRSGAGDQSDQLGSIFFRWVLPRSGFELYAELARNDRWAGVSDLLLEPEHGQGYTLGLQKTFGASPEGTLVFSAELTHLEAEGTSRVRDNPTFYAHGYVLEGYTHRGQLLGARAGPGGIQQHVGITTYSPQGLVSLWLERRVKDNDAFYYWAERAPETVCKYCKHDVSFEVGAEVMRFVGERELSVFADLTRQRNRWFEGPDVWNLGVGFGIRGLGGFTPERSSYER
ncbi:MAG TPA: hypothetical protein DEF01_02245 [Gemmatimonadetes bacterium]|nr:hypothetical protein [Gemmatimonadota bacterium]